VNQLRIPVKYLANLLTAGDTGAGDPVAGAHAGHARLPAQQACGPASQRWPCWTRWASASAMVEEMYHVMAIANYEDRFVIPTTHREYAENTFNVRGGCGFSFGNGCSEGTSEVSLFGSDKKRTIPIKAEI
jgi:nitrate reductase beta subunit